MKLLTHIIVLAIAIASLNAHADKKIIKWVDKNGVTQYGDKPPLPSKSEKYSVIKRGVTVQEVAPKKSSTAADAAASEQSRYDNALLASYNSSEEIEIARKRNVKIDTLALAHLEAKHKKLNANLQKNNKALLDFAKKNKTVPDNITKAIDKDMASIAKLDKKIESKKQQIDKINARYEKDKKRYAELESRKGNLNDIKYNNKNIAELNTWKADVLKRIDSYNSDILKRKRKGQKIPRVTQEGLLSASRELDRANLQIEEAEAARKRSRAEISN